MSENDRRKLQTILRECDIHARRIEHARRVCASWFPLNTVSYKSLTDNESKSRFQSSLFH